jgi:exonuclease III
MAFSYIRGSYQQLRQQFLSANFPNRIQRGSLCDIIVLNVHAPTENKCDDTKNSFYEQLQLVFDQFLKYHIKIWLGDFNAMVRREDIFKPTIGNESLHETSCREYNVPAS